MRHHRLAARAARLARPPQAPVRRDQIPAEYELHASVFLGGRGRPSYDERWNLSKANRFHVARLVLETIGRCEEVRIGTVYRRFDKPSELGTAKSGLYHAMVERIDRRLGLAGELALMMVDGDGTDAAYTAAHRALRLDTRHVIEDPVFRASGGSQWVQMVELVAYAAYQGLLREPAKRSLWAWYDEYLRPRDSAGGPLEL